MDGLIFGAGTALWLGLMTSISPCPLATNIAAISYMGKDTSSSRKIILSGAVYTFGRILVYTVLGALVVLGLLSIPSLSFFLQRHMNSIMGPVLVITGMFLLELLTLPGRGSALWARMQTRLSGRGYLGAFLLGGAFALSFCPVSAALFFGSLIPLAIKQESFLLLPSLFGLATGIPVILFALLIATGAQQMGRWFNRVSQVELWARRIAGVTFICGGIYLTLNYSFGII